jgi:MFS family permease
VVSSYLLVDTIATVLAGKFGDLFGRKPGKPNIAAAALCSSSTWGLHLRVHEHHGS